MRRVAWLALVLTAGPVTAANIDAAAAWRGWAGPHASDGGSSGELMLRLPPSSRVGDIDVELHSGTQRVQTRLADKAGAVNELRLPAPTDAPITFQAHYPDGSTGGGQFSFQLSERPLFAWAAGAAPKLADPDINLLAVSAEDFPRLAASYSSVAAIALDEATLKALDDAQVAALLAHLRSCGFAVLSGVSADVSAAFRNAAGCGARQLVVSAEPVSAQEALRLFKDREAWTPPRGAALAALAPTDRRLSWVIVALIGYLAVAVATLILTSKPLWLFGLPTAASLLLGTALALPPPRQQIVIWAEARDGDSQARFTGRLQLLGSAPQNASLVLPGLIDHATRCDAAKPSLMHWDSLRQRVVSDEVKLQLFATEALCFAGSFPLSYQATAMQNNAGELLLTNAGSAPWQDAKLIWEGRVYSANGLQALERLRASPKAGSAAVGPAERIAVERLGWGRAGLLLPLQLTALGADAGETSGWVFISLKIAAAHRSRTADHEQPIMSSRS